MNSNYSKRIWHIPLIFCFLYLGCTEKKKEDLTITIHTYSSAELTYPKNVVRLSDSSRKEFLENYFIPWDLTQEEVLNSLDAFPGKTLGYLKVYEEDDEWFGENKKPHKKISRQELVANVETETFPNFLQKGIVIAHTNLRRIPSNRPGFDRYSKAGEGYPFDYFQETNLWANTPLQLMHLTRDKQWCYVLSPYYKGWVKTHDLAVATPEFIATWQTGNYALPLSDSVVLENSNSIHATKGKVGMVLPVEDLNGSEDITTYYVNRNKNLEASILRANVSKAQLALSNFEFNSDHLKALVSEFEGRPYGCGGQLENRDCSSMIRDMMATFGIWLPRDSKDQIEIGKQFELKGSLDEKMNLIKEKGIPFQTILRKKGHNMHYVGNNESGEPLIFHAIWGLKTKYENKDLVVDLEHYPIEGIHQDDEGYLNGRHIIGEAVITSVMAGSENTNITVPLLEDIYAMTNILE